MSGTTPALQSLRPPSESIWGFRPTGEGGGACYQGLGPVSTPFPSDIHRISTERSAVSHTILEGRARRVPSLGLDPYSPARQHLISDTLTVTKSSDDGYKNTSQRPGAMINIPTYGNSAVLVILPDGRNSKNFGFNNISVYDKTNAKRYS